MTTAPDPNERTLSRRGARIVEHPPLAEYIALHFERSVESWDPRKRPDGYIALCIAENKLMWDVLGPRLAAVDDVPSRVLGYDAMIGPLEFREQLASFMGRAVLGRSVAAEQLAVVAGAGSVLELLFYAIADAGDGVLVPTPSYAGFWADLETRDELTILPVHGRSDDGFRLTTDLLDAAMDAASCPVKALLFTTPNNPLGCTYGRDEVLQILEWAESRGLHVVFDEIYALSVFGERSFVSVAAIRAVLGPRVHVVWGFSKDFGVSGLRCGVLFSENAKVLSAIDGLAYWAACSGDTLFRLGALIEDRSWVDAFVTQLRDSLRDAYSKTTAALDEGGIRYLPADAGMFLICDLRPFLSEATWEAEHQLWRKILDTANVNLTPGSACRVAEPGFFRLCYASEPTDAVVTGIRRTAAVLSPGRETA